ncbi:TIGR01244 family sulfur transferase [Sphingomonas astaxanthinifaciens]|uniref:TIGR01244 family protein n=1 Tax=Sphingomonas astaxanthinifaciens DSM 22298 TaxID=1123267 RepID=A0ABQ5Z1W1_9SPHN|nr:TIGR01244 family sulfur transferase [Sphingomonas astaxanthinifaciens]GLR46739.1 TIGR01244 family protein [Sphingomonas astaxanthinifaciens DSM 22298]
MTAFKPLDEKTLVAGQIHPEDLEEARRHGVTMVVNNRPDGEDDGQPCSDDIEAAAKAAGLEYRHIPIARGLGPTVIEQMRDAMVDVGDGKLLAYCRSGMRSTLAWAVACRENGVPREKLDKAAEAAGYNLSAVDHLL